MAKLLMYAKNFDRICDDLDFISFNIPSDYLSLLVALRPNSQVTRLDVGAMQNLRNSMLVKAP